MIASRRKTAPITFTGIGVDCPKRVNGVIVNVRFMSIKPEIVKLMKTNAKSSPASCFFQSTRGILGTQPQFIL